MIPNNKCNSSQSTDTNNLKEKVENLCDYLADVGRKTCEKSRKIFPYMRVSIPGLIIITEVSITFLESFLWIAVRLFQQ